MLERRPDPSLVLQDQSNHDMGMAGLSNLKTSQDVHLFFTNRALSISPFVPHVYIELQIPEIVGPLGQVRSSTTRSISISILFDASHSADGRSELFL